MPLVNMGLLTDPYTGQGRYTKFFINNGGKIHTFVYVAGIIWFLCLSLKSFNNGTYFSENALLPGLARGDFSEDMAAKKYYNELKQVMVSDPDSVPYKWFSEKFAEMYIDTHFHNYSVEYPYAPNTVFYGKNMYAILKASRSSSIEGIVVSATFHTPSSSLPDNSASFAIMLALAKFCRRNKYWAKDIVFLINDYDQLGAHAWLEAYHGVELGSGVLKHGTINARAGSLQAAINLEFHSPNISYIDVKVEGVNGQLPNLDLFNLVHMLCDREGIRSTFRNRTNPRKKDTSFKQWLHATTTLTSMMLTQALCVPTGNHGMYHRFGIEAVTLEAYEPHPKSRQQVAGFYQAGRILEGVLRSLNNLLERFHQSYFFYLLPSNDRFISIGLYMPAGCLIGSPLLIRALILWLDIYSQIKPKKGREPEDNAVKGDDSKPHSEEKEHETDKFKNIQFINIGAILLVAHTFGWLFVKSGVWLTKMGIEFAGLETHVSLHIGYLLYFILSVFIPRFFKLTVGKGNLLNIIALLSAATLFLTIAMHNFSLSLLLCIIYVPIFVTIDAKMKWKRKLFQSILLILVHPVVFIHLAVVIYTKMYENDRLIAEAWSGTSNLIMFLNVDNLIYGNWFIEAAFGFLVPVWILFWTLLHSTRQ